jgi:hypothetical protein
MDIASSANVGRPARRRLAFLERFPLDRSGELALPTEQFRQGEPCPTKTGRAIRAGTALTCLAFLISMVAEAQQSRPAPRFEGKAIPEPPEQGKPWTAPATGLPKFLVNATSYLFEQGVADPRGCEYRQVEIGQYSITKARGFVLPERADIPGRFVVCWDGLVYPALTVGDPADLDRDIKELVEALKQGKAGTVQNRFDEGSYWGFPRPRGGGFGISGVDDHTPIKLCLLLRLGRADLAETLFAAVTTWTPALQGRDLTDYQISYMSLASNWAGSAFGMLIGAHTRGDDVIALDLARKLAKFRDLATARAEAMGFTQPTRQNLGGAEPVARFPFLNQIDDLLRDHERRAAMPPRGPIPPKGGDPSARIAALIRDFDQINEQQMMSPGSAHPGSSPRVSELVAEGDPAVAPLLTVLESDDRLTRSASENSRSMTVDRFVHPVHEAAFAALIRILHTNEFANLRSYGWKPVPLAERKAQADSIRQFWEKTRSIPLVERWYRTLLDDSATQARWLEAAGGIISMDFEEGMPYPKPGSRPMKGESLRTGRDPSVTALMLQRAAQIARTGNPRTSRDLGLSGACQMATALISWNEKASLPLLQELCKQCRERSDQWLAGGDRNNSADQSLASNLAKFTKIRIKLGDAEAIDDYASWLRTTTPKMLEYGTFEALKPLLDQPDQPALASAARWLFNDPKSPWVPLLPEARGQQTPHFNNLFSSSLIVVAGFREGVLASLADKTPLGTVSRTEKGSIRRKITGGGTMNSGTNNIDLSDFPPDVEHSFRNCDFVASMLSGLEGCPKCDLFWPEARRDEAVAACVTYLTRFGILLTTEAPPGAHDFPDPKAHLRFPALGKLATPDDVTSARAIFSLEGQGEARVVNLPGGFPQQARWVTLKDMPVDRTYYPEGVTRREYDTDGYIWQAEEVRKGDGWERFYGFVGHHVIARAPASEIEFGGRLGPGWNLKGGLDARMEMVEPRPAGFEPGRPILVALHIRNRLGVDHPSPTELLRPSPDGKPALRKGVSLSLWYTSLKGPNSGLNQPYPQDPIEPKRDANFNPGDASRNLATLETFEAMRIDLNDWYDLSKPGKYRLRAVFAADSGMGEGSAADVSFQVGNLE